MPQGGHLADRFAMTVLRSLPATYVELRACLVRWFHCLDEAAAVLLRLQTSGAQELFRAMEPLYLQGSQADYIAFIANLRQLMRAEIAVIPRAADETEDLYRGRQMVLTEAMKLFFGNAATHKHG